MIFSLGDHQTQCYHSIRWTLLYNGVIRLWWLDKSKLKIVYSFFHYLCFPTDLLLSWQHPFLVIPQLYDMKYLLCRTIVISGKCLYQGDSRLSFSCSKAAALLGKRQWCGLSGNHCLCIASDIASERHGVRKAYCYMADGKKELWWRILLYTGAWPPLLEEFQGEGRKQKAHKDIFI